MIIAAESFGSETVDQIVLLFTVGCQLKQNFGNQKQAGIILLLTFPHSNYFMYLSLSLLTSGHLLLNTGIYSYYSALGSCFLF